MTINFDGNDGNFTINDFSNDPDAKVKGALNDTIDTPIGQIAVTGNISENSPKSIHVSKTGVAQATAGFLGGLSVTVDKESQVIRLTYTDVSPQRAEDLLNTLIAVYNDNWIYDRNQISSATSDFIRERLKVIEGELGNVDSDISSFKSEHLMPDVNAAASIAMQQANEAQSAIRDLELKISMARYVRDYLSSEANKFQLLPTTTGIDNLNVASQISEYNNKLMERNSLLTSTTESNPLVEEMDKAWPDSAPPSSPLSTTRSTALTRR